MPWRSGGALVLSIVAASLAACKAEEKAARGSEQSSPGENSIARPHNLYDTMVAMVPPDTAPAWTAGIVEGEGETVSMAYLSAVRFGAHGTYDRAVFEFRNSLPGYHVEYVDRPVRACGSGKPVPLPGLGWLEIRFNPAAAHSESGESLLPAREAAPGLPILKEAALTCDFEGVVTWVLAVQAPNRYRVQVLGDPARLVVDIRHRG